MNYSLQATNIPTNHSTQPKTRGLNRTNDHSYFHPFPILKYFRYILPKHTRLWLAENSSLWLGHWHHVSSPIVSYWLEHTGYIFQSRAGFEEEWSVSCHIFTYFNGRNCKKNTEGIKNKNENIILRPFDNLATKSCL